MKSTAVLSSLLEDTISVMLHAHVSETRATPPPQRWAGTVHIGGGFDGVVVLECAKDAARRAAAALVGNDDVDALSDDDVADAFAEMTNIVGGNAKATLSATLSTTRSTTLSTTLSTTASQMTPSMTPSPTGRGDTCTLSLPVVHRDGVVDVDGDELYRRSFVFCRDVFVVRVLEAPGHGPPRPRRSA